MMQSAEPQIRKLLPFKIHSQAITPNQKLTHVSMALFKL